VSDTSGNPALTNLDTTTVATSAVTVTKALSEASPETIRRAHAVHPITALQSEWSLWTRDPETNGVLETVRELGIGFVAYSPLGRGMLTGRFTSPDEIEEDDFRKRHPRFSGRAREGNLRTHTP